LSFDELNAPLGQHKRKRVSKLPAAVPRLLVGVLGLFVLAVVAWAMFVNDPLGGEPVAVVAIPGAKPADGKQKPTAVDPNATGSIAKTAEPPPGSKTVTIIDGSTGKRREIVIPQ
jgi:uncharacterized protein